MNPAQTETADLSFTSIYINRNPLVRFALRRYLDTITELVAIVADSVTCALDAGCGEGFVTRCVRSQHPSLRLIPLDLDRRCVGLVKSLSKGEVEAVQGSVLSLPFPDRAFDLVLANEILEHLADPERALDELRRVCAGYLIVSVPDEPLFSLANLTRGTHIRRLGRTPGHVNAWSVGKFVRLLRAHRWSLLRIRRCLPWIIILARSSA